MIEVKRDRKRCESEQASKREAQQQQDRAAAQERFADADLLEAEIAATTAEADALAQAHGFTPADLDAARLDDEGSARAAAKPQPGSGPAGPQGTTTPPDLDENGVPSGARSKLEGDPLREATSSSSIARPEPLSGTGGETAHLQLAQDQGQSSVECSADTSHSTGQAGLSAVAQIDHLSQHDVGEGPSSQGTPTGRAKGLPRVPHGVDLGISAGTAQGGSLWDPGSALRDLGDRDPKAEVQGGGLASGTSDGSASPGVPPRTSRRAALEDVRPDARDASPEGGSPSAQTKDALREDALGDVLQKDEVGSVPQGDAPGGVLPGPAQAAAKGGAAVSQEEPSRGLSEEGEQAGGLVFAAGAPVAKAADKFSALGETVHGLGPGTLPR